MNRKTRNILIVVIIILAAVVTGFLLAAKITGVNQFANLQNSISQLFKQQVQPSPKPVELKSLEASTDTKQLTTYANATTITIKSNKEISVKDNNKVELFLSRKPVDSDPNYLYVAKINNIGMGDYSLNLNVNDADGNTKTITATITRLGFSLPFGLTEIKDWDNSTYTADGDNLLAEVNKQHKLPADYVPQDLLDINKDLLLYTNTSDPVMIRREAGQALQVMAKAMQKENGKNLVIQSAYRSFNDQYKTYVGWVKDLGQDEADKTSARPGFSEHQLGTAVDFVDQETGLALTNDFQNGVAGQWLLANAYKYGFVMSYPEGKEGQTGYSHEAWHWRYIGIDNATKVKESGLTLKEWLDQNVK